MADFLRPEARAILWRWREALTGGAIVCFGLWWGIGAATLVQWIGWAFVALGVTLILSGIQRGRFRQGAGGLGTVQLDERRVNYFGPLSGGMIDLEDVFRLELDPQTLPAPHWILSGVGGQRVAIPINADGAEALFDAFASLPGIRTDQLVARMERHPQSKTLIWERAPALIQ